MRVGDHHRHLVHARRTRVAALRGAVVQRAGDYARVRVNRQARRQVSGRVGERIAVDVYKSTGRGDVDATVGIHTHLWRQRGHRVRDVVEVDGQRGRGFVTVGIAHGVGEHIHRVGHGDAGIGHVGVAAVGVERQGAVGSGDGRTRAARCRRAAVVAGHHADHPVPAARPAIGTGIVVAKHVACHRIAFGHAVGVVGGGGQVVDDGNGQCAAGRLWRGLVVCDLKGDVIGIRARVRHRVLERVFVLDHQLGGRTGRSLHTADTRDDQRAFARVDAHWRQNTIADVLQFGVSEGGSSDRH